ncbi:MULTISPECIES: S-adenosyl-L-homocysteine hydrolase [unclassified Novosphingobium]|uniref:S-adenosyl-L-homocysteine hydrolase n=1 Tax=unclassified Novosphingobium TaxID=2644732 RepID=UPI001356A068|nr:MULTISPECIES: S-adenosyl-L-homocysteine hydrolase [unclassified Novosphingobium]
MACGLGLAQGLTTPAHAEAGDAQKLRRMDIMLMVTGLRCRTTADNFMEDYGRFTSSHMAELNEANGELRAQLAVEAGEEGAVKALDKMSVVMANEYGAGHPWLSCHELHQVAQGLASVQGHETLVEVAGQLLERQPRPLLALAGR